ncbi:MAG: A/G-specific adenine glycosylase [Actinomycetota bacterium]|nr:A/G-specific adenine glycosylase [Actinomycetota bacterium]
MAVPTGTHEALLAWGEATRRDLPWRRTRDPWAVLVSELMLQQTQVARVATRYPAFLRRFPDPAACATAPVSEVVRAWAGLGYNRRAVHLHGAATAVVDRHGGVLPDRLDALLRLPGVGAYTARAVLAFAFEVDVGLVETNTGRVLARAFAGRRLPSPSSAQAVADGAVPAGRAWAWNQALMDLGATVCTRRQPRCDTCPVRPSCRWAATGFEGPDPMDGSAPSGRRQGVFAGSDRQARGRLVDALRRAPVPLEGIAAAAGWPDAPARAVRVAAALVAEGLAVADGDDLRLP